MTAANNIQVTDGRLGFYGAQGEGSRPCVVADTGVLLLEDGDHCTVFEDTSVVFSGVLTIDRTDIGSLPSLNRFIFTSDTAEAIPTAVWGRWAHLGYVASAARLING